MNSIKRLHNEIVELYEKYNNFTVIYKKLVIDFVILGRLKFVIPSMYPFRPPEMFILKLVENNPIEINYVDSLRTNSHRIKKYLECYYDGCICCKTMLIPNNWSPTYHIQKIIQEIEIYNEMKCMIKYHLCLDDIMWKYIYKKPLVICSDDYYIDVHGLAPHIKSHILSFIDPRMQLYYSRAGVNKV